MKTNTISIFISILSLVVLASCDKDGICKRGSGAVERREIYLSEITSIDVEGNATLYITQGEEQKIEVETNKNLFSVINHRVKNGEWDAKFDHCVRKGKLTFYVTLKNIHELEVSGSGKIIGETQIKSDKLKVSVEGSGEVKLQIETRELESDVEGSGNITLSGTTSGHRAEVEGSGKIQAYDLISRSADIKIEGSGKALINVEDNLSVKISGSGDVIYKGNPKVNSKISGSGKVSAY